MKARFWGGLFALLIAAPAHAITACSWDSPGANRFRGSVPDAVDKYKDIPAGVRAELKQRMKERDFDEVATITRDSIRGKDVAYSDLRDMHFGAGKVCNRVSRSKWKDTHTERGLVYCESGHCIIVPTVCNNVSRVTRVVPPVEPPLEFDPPGAGPLPSAPPTADVPPSMFFTPPVATYDPPATFRNPAPLYPWPEFHGSGARGYLPPHIVRPPVGVPPVVSPPGSTPDTPPVAPPEQPPVNPPIDPPTTPPVLPPGEPPVTPPVNPPVDPPVLPPVDPPGVPNIPVTPPVPEPETYAMVLAGLGILARKKLTK